MAVTQNSEALTGLFDTPVRPPTASTAERVVEVLRSYLLEGRLLPGTRLSEETLAGGLAVSRNTLREAFRILAHERLVVHELNRGVFVRQLTAEDVDSIYQLRILLETAAVAEAGHAGPSATSRLRLAVTEGLAAAERSDWRALGTANMHFHLSLAALAGNPRLDSVMAQLLAELRLAFHTMTPPEAFHLPYLEDNQEICRRVEAGDGTGAADLLHDYLDRARRQLVGAFTAG